MSTHFSSIWPRDRILSDASTPSKSEPGSDGSKRGIPHSQKSNIHEASLSECLVSYAGHSLEKS